MLKILAMAMANASTTTSPAAMFVATQLRIAMLQKSARAPAVSAQRMNLRQRMQYARVPLRTLELAMLPTLVMAMVSVSTDTNQAKPFVVRPLVLAMSQNTAVALLALAQQTHSNRRALSAVESRTVESVMTRIHVMEQESASTTSNQALLCAVKRTHRGVMLPKHATARAALARLINSNQTTLNVLV